MNILYIPPVGAVKEHDDFYLSLAKLHSVDWCWEVNDKTVYNIIHLQSGSISRAALQGLKVFHPKAIITQWTGDYRPEGLPEVRMYEGLVDITFLASDTPEQYPNMNVKWLPHWVGEWQFRPVNPDAKGIVMIANNYPQFPGGLERHEMNEMLRHRDDYVVYGSGFTNSRGSVNFRDTPDIYNQFRFAVGCNIYNDVPKYFSNRPLAAMAAGTCFLFREVPDLLDIFSSAYYIPVYSENDDLSCLLDVIGGDWRYYAEGSQAAVRAYFHSDVIVQKYLSML